MSLSVSLTICAAAGAAEKMLHETPHANSNAAHALRIAVIAASPRGSMLEKASGPALGPTPKAKPDCSNRQQESLDLAATGRTRSARRLDVFLAHHGFLPGMVGVERGHSPGNPCGSRPEILLEHLALVVDQERHHAGIAVLGGPRDQRKAADHAAVHDVIEDAAGRGRALPGQDLEVIAVVRDRTAANLVALPGRLRDRVAERAVRLTRRGRPIEPVLLAGTAEYPLRVDRHAVLVLRHLGVVVLRVEVSEDSLDRRQLVAADAARQ